MAIPIIEAVLCGSLNTDLLTRTSVMPGPGETVFGTSFTVGFGGKGANQGVIFSRLSGGVKFSGAVGNDGFGRDYLAYLSSSGISTENIETLSAASTGCAPIWVDEVTGENRIIVVPGANLLVNVTSVRDVVKSTSLSERKFAVICQNEINPDATAAALHAGAQHGALTVLTPAPVPPTGISSSLLSSVSVLIPNIHEAAALAGHSVSIERDNNPVAAATSAAAVLLERGCRSVVITLGSKGCLVARAGGQEPVHVAGTRVATVVDTTGAGDAFSGSLAYFILLLAGNDPKIEHSESYCPSLEVLVEAAERACFVAAMTVTKEGTQSSYPMRAEVPAILLDASAKNAAASAALELLL